MTQIETQSPTFHAPVDRFIPLRNSPLMGSVLDDVRAIETSLLKFGLFSPLTAIRHKGRLMVIDGRKRLAALRRLAFEGRLPSSLRQIPYILSDTETANPGSHSPEQLNSETCFRMICRQFEAGKDVSEISDRLGMTRQTIRQFLTLNRLAKPIQKAFFRRLISFDIAQAYAAIPDRSEQLALFSQLGFSADAETVLRGAQSDTGLALAA